MGDSLETNIRVRWQTVCQHAFFPKWKGLWDGGMEGNPTENSAQMLRQRTSNMCDEGRKSLITHLKRLSGEGK